MTTIKKVIALFRSQIVWKVLIFGSKNSHSYKLPCIEGDFAEWNEVCFALCDTSMYPPYFFLFNDVLFFKIVLEDFKINDFVTELFAGHS